MDRMKIAAIFADQEQLGGKEITVCGWARTIRDMKPFGFIELNDGSCFRNLQVVMSADELHNYKEIAGQNVGAALIVRGTVVLTPEAKQPLELRAAEIAVEGRSTPDYPLQKKRHSVEFLRTIQHLRPRTNLFSATFRVRSVAAQAVHTFFQDRGFVYVQTPIITGSDCEGAGEMFRVTTLDLDNIPRTADGKVDFSKDFFGKSTNLTVSGQLNAENFALAFGGSFVETVVTGLANVQWLANGLKLAGQMLPGLGFAILLRYLPVRRNLHYLALGFGLTAMLTVLYSNVQSLGAAVSSIVGSEVFAKLPEEQAITFVNNFKSVSMIGIAIIGIFLAVQHFKNSQRTVVAAPVTESESGEIEDDEF